MMMISVVLSFALLGLQALILAWAWSLWQATGLRFWFWMTVTTWCFMLRRLMIVSDLAGWWAEPPLLALALSLVATLAFGRSLYLARRFVRERRTVQNVIERRLQPLITLNERLDRLMRSHNDTS